MPLPGSFQQRGSAVRVAEIGATAPILSENVIRDTVSNALASTQNLETFSNVISNTTAIAQAEAQAEEDYMLACEQSLNASLSLNPASDQIDQSFEAVSVEAKSYVERLNESIEDLVQNIVNARIRLRALKAGENSKHNSNDEDSIGI